MKDWPQQVATFLWKRRLTLAALCIVAAGIAATQIASLKVSNSMDVWYPEDHPELLRYRSFLDTWGSDELVIVAATTDWGRSFATDAGDELVGSITDALLDVPGVATVTSRVTVPDSLADVRGRLLSADGRTTVMLVQLLRSVTDDAGRHAVLVDIDDTVSGFGVRTRLAGYGVIYDALNRESTSGAATLIAAAHAVMIVLLGVFYRRFFPVLITVAAVGLASTWTMGLYVAMDQQLNMVTMALPTLVLVIGVTDCLHIFRSVARQPAHEPHSERVVRGVSEVIGPCILTTATTAAGFLALTLSSLPVVRNLGLFGAIGMLAAFLASFVIGTAGLSFANAVPASGKSMFDRIAEELRAIGDRHAARVLSGFAAVAIVAGTGLLVLQTDTYSIGYLEPEHELRRDSDYIERSVGPYLQLDFLVSTPDGVLDEIVLDAVQAWQIDARQVDQVGWSWCLLDALGIGRDTRPSSLGQRAVRGRLERLQKFAPVTTGSMISGESQLRVSFGVPVQSARGVSSLVEQLTDIADFPDRVDVRAAGYAPLYTRIVDELVMSQVYGFAAALVLIAALIGAAMRSVSRVLLAIPANAVPVALTLGLMGLTGIPLDVATATIATVILGLVVDDTVHMLNPVPGKGLRASLRQATARSGGTLLMTTLVLAGGLMVMGFAEIRSIAWFGLLSAFAMVVAILADLLLLPALARMTTGNQFSILLKKCVLTH